MMITVVIKKNILNTEDFLEALEKSPKMKRVLSQVRDRQHSRYVVLQLP
jgi:hypothetical protein